MNATTTNETTGDPSLAPLLGVGGEGGPPIPGANPGGIEGLAIDAGARRSRVSGSWLLLGGAILVSAGMLWGMRWIGMKGGITGKDLKFDASLVEAANRPKRNHAVVLEDLKVSRITHQVPGEQVKKNPFRLADAMSGAFPTAQGDDGTAAALAALDAVKRQEMEREQTIEGERKGFKLQMVLGGGVPLARVNGKTVRVGDTLGKFHKVVAIHGRTIEVEADRRTWEIGMAPTDVGDPSSGVAGSPTDDE